MPPDDFPCLRLYAGSLPSGRVLAGVETFPALRHRSFARCHRPYAGEPCGCIHPIPSPQALAFADKAYNDMDRLRLPADIAALDALVRQLIDLVQHTM